MGRRPRPPATRGPVSMGGPSCPHPQRGAGVQAWSGCSVKGDSGRRPQLVTHMHTHTHAWTHAHPSQRAQAVETSPGWRGILLRTRAGCSEHERPCRSCPTQTRAWGLRLGATGAGPSHQPTSQDRRLHGPLTGYRGGHCSSPPAVTGEECGLCVPYFNFFFLMKPKRRFLCEIAQFKNISH